MVHADLKLFLETNLPRSGKKKAVLGVSDAKIGAALQEEFGLSIQTSGVVAEIIRGKKLLRSVYYNRFAYYSKMVLMTIGTGICGML